MKRYIDGDTFLVYNYRWVIIMERLKTARKRTGKTQNEVAAYIEISRSAYSNYETGNREPDIETLKKLSKFLDTSVSYLLGETDVPTCTENGKPELSEDDVTAWIENAAKKISVDDIRVKEGLISRLIYKTAIYFLDIETFVLQNAYKNAPEPVKREVFNILKPYTQDAMGKLVEEVRTKLEKDYEQGKKSRREKYKWESSLLAKIHKLESGKISYIEFVSWLNSFLEEEDKSNA